MDLTWASLSAADTTLKRWRALVAAGGLSLSVENDHEIHSALFKDLDTPRVLQRLRTIEKDSTIDSMHKRAIFLYADQVLGLDLDRVPQKKILSNEQAELLKARGEARTRKDFAESDRLRDLLETTGLAIHDGPDGQSWS
jgi:cysteinyl-tRNA synthetase